jgi:hypothetical protein
MRDSLLANAANPLLTSAACPQSPFLMKAEISNVRSTGQFFLSFFTIFLFLRLTIAELSVNIVSVVFFYFLKISCLETIFFRFEK